MSEENVRQDNDESCPQASAEVQPQRPPLFKRTWFLPVATLLLGVIIGVAVASPSSNINAESSDLQNQVVELEQVVHDLTADLDSLKRERDDLAAQLDPIRRAEEEAAAAAKAQADAEAAEAAAAAAAAAANTYTDGVYLVGVDMQAGRYKGIPSNPDRSGYWAVLADANGRDIVANGNVKGQFYIEARDGQYVELSHVEATLVE